MPASCHLSSPLVTRYRLSSARLSRRFQLKSSGNEKFGEEALTKSAGVSLTVTHRSSESGYTTALMPLPRQMLAALSSAHARVLPKFPAFKNIFKSWPSVIRVRAIVFGLNLRE